MLIGKKVTIKEAKNKTIQGKQGTVLDETTNTITIKTQDKELTIIKEQIITIEEHT